MDWDDALHAILCNKQVDEYNVKTLFAKCTDCICVVAKDLQKDSSTSRQRGKVKKKNPKKVHVHKLVSRMVARCQCNAH